MTTACPACATMPDTTPMAEGGLQISLPTIHCAACMRAVEQALADVDGVISARVNLGLKRVRIETAPGVSAAPCLAAIRAAGYDALELDGSALGQETDPTGRRLLIAMGVSGFAMMNVMLLSVSVWSGADVVTRDMFHWISAVIAVPAVAYAGRPFFDSAVSALKAGRLNMEVPISLALILATGMSIFETAQSGRHAYFDAALSLTFFLLIGRYLDHRTRIAARSAARELAALEPSRADKITARGVETVPIADVALGDILHIPAGMRVPTDGIVTRGHTTLDRGLVTGESAPVAAGVGDTVVAGEVNLTGTLEMRVTAVGADTTLRRMAAMVEVAESARNKYSGLADRAAAVYAPVVHIMALVALLGWWMYSGDLRLSLNIAIAVLIITCPCALGLAVPAVSTAASGRLFRQGILLKNATALERLAEVDCVVFDKTGTLTDGAAAAQTGLSRDEMSVLKALALASSHPVARGLLAGLPGDLPAADLDHIEEISGNGVQASWDGTPVALGRGAWLNTIGNPTLKIGTATRALATGETMRLGVAEAVRGLKAAGVQTILLTGDTAHAADRIAARAGIADVRADMRPEDKVAVLDALKANGRKVLMVGDGLNDTPALASAFVSMAPASAMDVARVVSDMVLLNPDVAVLPDALDLAKRARKRIVENFATAAIYNVVAVPLALFGFCTPLMAALAMSTSSISVLLNALRLRK
ncbi:heavy metal translocating P-type ATPase [Oceaniglobus ichthyenteri]|uniref:heavy metal translocating P-type ATPase n=1 Tax=Oceaniglobus ichthyenteri TaxID=2136177 RepID=UPI000D38E5D7|nr:heavy metal translocating P-type ATPase [Oceaniglobus ichthyenteri]